MCLEPVNMLSTSGITKDYLCRFRTCSQQARTRTRVSRRARTLTRVCRVCTLRARRAEAWSCFRGPPPPRKQEIKRTHSGRVPSTHSTRRFKPKTPDAAVLVCSARFASSAWRWSCSASMPPSAPPQRHTHSRTHARANAHAHARAHVHTHSGADFRARGLIAFRCSAGIQRPPTCTAARCAVSHLTMVRPSLRSHHRSHARAPRAHTRTRARIWRPPRARSLFSHPLQPTPCSTQQQRETHLASAASAAVTALGSLQQSPRLAALRPRSLVSRCRRWRYATRTARPTQRRRGCCAHLRTGRPSPRRTPRSWSSGASCVAPAPA